jgi:hypothetical protein
MRGISRPACSYLLAALAELPPLVLRKLLDPLLGICGHIDQTRLVIQAPFRLSEFAVGGLPCRLVILLL